MAAWDSDAGGGKKIFGIYDSAADFVDGVLMNRSDQRYGYEVLPNGKPVRAYFDVEWTCPVMETGHQTLRALLAYFKTKIEAAYPGASTDCSVACASRPLNKLIKASYHIVYHGLVFSSNCDGALKRLATVEDTPVRTAFTLAYTVAGYSMD